MTKTQAAYLAAIKEFENALSSQDIRWIEKAERALARATRRGC